jgi:hypothetical protein
MVRDFGADSLRIHVIVDAADVDARKPSSQTRRLLVTKAGNHIDG